jgi:pantoate--beta-alanine ligase
MIEVAQTVAQTRAKVKEWKSQGLTVGLVPTMGYLHEGHQSLIKKAVEENDRVVVSIFVNPIQFAPNEDLATYPRDLEADKKLCESTGASLIFHPTPEEMYPSGFSTSVAMEGLTKELCGKTRPTHFGGVCTVVSKLFNIVQPDKAYFGQKDAQQLAIVKRMVKDLNFDLEIVGCPIVREADGLAKSSRNTYLSKDERQAALILSKAISLGQEMVQNGEKSAQAVIKAMTDKINTEPLAKIDYVNAVNALTIEPVEEIKGEVLVAIAVYIGKTRLIDNFITINN